LQCLQQIAQFKESLNGYIWSANNELRTVGAEHPGRKATGRFVGKSDEYALTVPVFQPLLDTKGLANERVPWVIQSDLLKNVSIM
jgi:hypothetical protein